MPLCVARLTLAMDTAFRPLMTLSARREVRKRLPHLALGTELFLYSVSRP